jgi:hypothetical protein
LMFTITALAAIARGYEYTGVPDTRGAFVMFVGVGFATAVSALWLQMLIYAVLWGRRHRAAELTVE